MKRHFAPGLRLASRVKRWPTVETIRQNSIAEHMFYVAHYAMDICWIIQRPELIGSCLSMAMIHDLEETITGDIPGPVPSNVDYDWLSSQYRKRFGEHMWIEDPYGKGYSDSYLIVKAADVIDQLMEAAVEISLGNEVWGSAMRDVATKQMVEALGSLPAHTTLQLEVRDKAMSAYNALARYPTIIGV